MLELDDILFCNALEHSDYDKANEISSPMSDADYQAMLTRLWMGGYIIFMKRSPDPRDIDVIFETSCNLIVESLEGPLVFFDAVTGEPIEQKTSIQR